MKGSSAFTSHDADEIRALLGAKTGSDREAQKKCRRRLRDLGFFISDFARGADGFTAADFDELVRSGNVTISEAQSRVRVLAEQPSAAPPLPTRTRRTTSDESYVIDLCDEILGQRALRQHRFPFLVGDTGVRLPVDAYYSEFSLVVEYLERQHHEPVGFFDRRSTVSGVPRSEQRRLYDERRRQILPTKGIGLLEISATQLSCNSRQRLRRHRIADLEALRRLLVPWLNRGSERPDS